MKILLVGRNCHVGGGNTFRYRAALGLIARGHQVFLAAQGGPMAPKFRAAGVAVTTLLPTPLNRIQLKSLLRRGDFDIVHACNPTAGDDVFAASRGLSLRAAKVQSIHGVLPPSVQSASGNPSLLHSDAILCFDQSARASLQKLAGMEARAIGHVPRPVAPRSEPVAPQTPPLLVMVSRLSKSKGKTALAAIEAVEKLQSEFPGLRLHIVGEGSLRGEVQKRCAEVNARAGSVICEALGALLDPFPAMTGASGVVGTAYVALEALFHGIPVVASGYEAFGVVTPENLSEAVACNFGDSWTGDKSAQSLQSVTPDLMTASFRTVLTRFGTPQGQIELREMGARLRSDHSLDAVARQLEAIYVSAREKRAG